MFRKKLLLAALLSLGCQKNYNVANPVVGPAPPRISNAREVFAEASPESSIQTVKFESESPLPMTAEVARVNGKVVLAADVLEQYATRLAEVRAKTTDAEFRKIQDMLIQRDLPAYIEQAVMADSVRAKLKKEQLDGLETQLDKFFDLEVQGMKEKSKAQSTAELEFILQEQGLSLESMRKRFGDRALASEFVKAKIGEDPPITAKELMAEYQAHLDEYAHPAKVKWQQLQISTSRHGTETKARQVMDQALADLGSGMAFSDVVKKYSDGPLKESGGSWDWTQPESVASDVVRNALQSVPIGETSPVLTTKTSLQVVKVVDRREAGHQKFEEVQESIRKDLVKRWRDQRAEEVIEEVKKTAIVETIYDGLSTSQTAAQGS